jgi:hypothetical protein
VTEHESVLQVPHESVESLNALSGQPLFVPSQLSAMSQTPAEARHSDVTGATPSAGQFGPEPLHDSATSQTPEAVRQVEPLVYRSVGQVLFVPSQFSATSQTPAVGRQTEAVVAT